MKICCPHCSGKGKVELAGPLKECLEVMQRIGPATRSEIHAESPDNGNSVTATFRRVERLKGLGLVKEEGGKWAVKLKA